jgi:RNA polymerase sigma-70 factor, ECF subfamily
MDESDPAMNARNPDAGRSEAAQNLDPGAVDALLQRHLPGLRAFVRLRVNPALRAKESCSDLVQSVCTDLLENLDHFDYQGEAPFRAWLFTSALNKIREHERYFARDKRDVNREVRLSDAEARSLADCYASCLSPSLEAMVHEKIALIEAAFDRLPEDYREVLTLKRCAGLSHAEIAGHLGRTEGAVRTLLSRALTRLSGVIVALEED